MTDQRTPSEPSGAGQARFDWRMGLVILLGAACLTGWVDKPIALGAGIALALIGLAPTSKGMTKLAKLLIQIGVVLLGLSMDLRQVAEAGLVGVIFAAGTIVGTFALGVVLGRVLGIEAKLTALLSSGTAICGGSAIVATGSVIAATQTQIAVALGAVFVLNAVALYVFPPLGHMLDLGQVQFGTWAAVAIHDVANVLGAAEVFDRTAGSHAIPSLALKTATAVKLTRALWIAPVALVCAWVFRSRDGAADTKRKVSVPIPWFILWFVVAAAVGTFVPALQFAAKPGALAASRMMTVALLLIGCGLSRSAIAGVGWRAFVLALSLWAAISVASLLVVRWTITG